MNQQQTMLQEMPAEKGTIEKVLNAVNALELHGCRAVLIEDRMGEVLSEAVVGEAVPDADAVLVFCARNERGGRRDPVHMVNAASAAVEAQVEAGSQGLEWEIVRFNKDPLQKLIGSAELSPVVLMLIRYSERPEPDRKTVSGDMLRKNEHVNNYPLS
jgi:hypothetical protein